MANHKRLNRSKRSRMAVALFRPRVATGSSPLGETRLMLGHTKLESTVRYLGIEVDDALSISEQVEL